MRESDLERFRFWSDRENKSRSCKSKQASRAESDAEMVLAPLYLFARGVQQLRLCAQKNKPTSTTFVSGVAKRRAE